MPEEAERQALVDAEHLKLLSWGYYISAGVAALFSLLGVFYMLMGAVMGAAIFRAAERAAKPNQFPAAFPLWFFGIFGFVIFLAAITAAVLRFMTARNIRRRKSRVFCIVIAALGCLEFPYGIVLAVFSFVVLSRPSVVRMFNAPGDAGP